jgi:exo-beta-1,3-glucanase (GH17 family)
LKKAARNILLYSLFINLIACTSNGKKDTKMKEKNISDILGNPDYLAISYGGYRTDSRRVQPAMEQLKEDMKILAAMGIKIIRTYNVHMPHAVNVIKAIDELKKEDKNFEMYVMLGAWIDCKNAWTGFEPIHEEESERNAIEIEQAVQLANEHPDIVKVISVGNEAMVKWATAYFVSPIVILKWVNYLQDLKQENKLPKDTWITSSDNFASWGGGEDSYKGEELTALMKSVDYISIHTYPMHDTHYNPIFWGVSTEEEHLSNKSKIDSSMQRAAEYAQSQYYSVKDYMLSLGIDKPIHIGETGWASYCNGMYGNEGSMACDEYKEGLFYKLLRAWTKKEGIACFYFEAFDEVWKDSDNPNGSENHFGLITIDGKVKFALWDLVDQGAFDGLRRGVNPITKTFEGNQDSLLNQVKLPPLKEVLIPEYQTQ